MIFMSNRKKFSEEESKNIGFRIRACRVLTGLTQEEFGARTGLSVPSIKIWEYGGVIPRVEGLKNFTELLRQFDIFASVDWLLYGKGTGPSYSLNNCGEDDGDNFLSDELSAFKEMFEKKCKKIKANPILIEVRDNEMAPLFCRGDFIAGILLDKESFDNNPTHPSLVLLKDGTYAPRYLHLVDDEFFTCSNQTPSIRKEELSSFGKIIWHRRC